MRTMSLGGRLRFLGFVAVATFACSGLAGASTVRYTQRGDTANGIWNSNDGCTYRSAYLYAGKGVTISPSKSLTNYLNLTVYIQNICTGDLDWGSPVDGTGAILTLHGATSATLKGVVAMSMSHSNVYTGDYVAYTTNATLDLSFTAFETPIRTRSDSSTISPGLVVVQHRLKGTLAYAIGTGSMVLDDGTQIINGNSDTASIGQNDESTLTMYRP